MSLFLKHHLEYIINGCFLTKLSHSYIHALTCNFVNRNNKIEKVPDSHH